MILARFDNPYLQTGGEFTFWNPIGGAINLVTTTRLIGVSSASNINDEFNFFYMKVQTQITQQLYTIGEALDKAKNGTVSQIIEE